MAVIKKWKGGTALVTGASSGIGAAFARLLAKGGCNVIMTARRLERLEEMAAETGNHGVDMVPLKSDLSRDGAARELAEEIAGMGKEVALLVNNAGVGLSGSFVKNEWEEVERMIALNVTALTELTHLLLPGMIERGRGDILLVGSIAAYMPAPTQAVYSGTKAFVHSFGCALAYELKDTPVNVTVLNPGGTTTEWMETAGYTAGTPPKLGMSTPEEVAECGLRAMAGGKYFTEPGFANQAISRLTAVMPMQAKLNFAYQVQKFIGGRE